jgi:ABC-2 type transport system ATP-binding protein
MHYFILLLILNMSVLQIKNISKRYGNIIAVNNLELTVNKGDVYGILGPNGSGKTTTLSIILGILKPESGSYRWEDNDDNVLINKKIGSLLEQPNFYPYLSILKNLKIAATIKELNFKGEDEFERVLQITKLSERRHSQFRTLSFGMKQRLTLASVLLGDPQVLILDEPTNGLDPEGIADVRNIILAEAKKGKTIILASHILDEVEKVCSHVAILKRGNLIANGLVSELIKADDVIILSTEKIDEIYDLLVRSGMYKRMDKKGNDIYITLNEDYKPKDLNEFAFKNGFVLSKFEIKKSTLEEKFLEIVKK